MMSEHDTFCRIHDLVVAELDSSSSDRGRRELQDLVCSDGDAARCYVRYMHETASLQWMFSDRAVSEDRLTAREVISTPVIAKAPKTSRLLLAVAAMVLLSCGWWVFSHDLPGRPSKNNDASLAGDVAMDPSLGSVAILSHVVDPRWAMDTAPAKLLQRLQVGQTLALDAGFAEVTFDCGAQVRLKGPARFIITSARTARCDEGFVTAEVGEQGRGFSIDTPAAKVVDLGTRFGLGVDDASGTKVIVFDGIVDLTPTGEIGGEGRPADVTRLNQGEAIRVDSKGTFRRVMSIKSTDFPLNQPLQATVPSRCVIVDAHDNIRDSESKKFYQIVPGGLSEDVRAFVDRPHQWNGIDATGIPEELIGADFIMPFNDDKFVENLEVSVTVGRPAVLYLFLSAHLIAPPWIQDEFENTGLVIGLDEGPSRFKKLSVDRGPGSSVDTHFSVWKKVIRVPSTVQLGALRRPDAVEGFNMYGIAAVPIQ